MDNFIYETPTKVYFGKDEEKKVGKIIKEYAPKKILIHYGGGSAKKSGLFVFVSRRKKRTGFFSPFTILNGVFKPSRERFVAAFLCFSKGNRLKTQK